MEQQTLTWQEMFERLIGKKQTERLLKKGEVEIEVDANLGYPYPAGPLKFKIVLNTMGIRRPRGAGGFCINPRYNAPSESQLITDRQKLDYKLSILFPKVALLISAPGKFLRTAG